MVALLILRTAWLSDDAYITLRVVDNFFHGYGLRWNIGERVQVYTHPLWLLLLLTGRGLTGEVFYTTTLLGAVLSLLAVGTLGLGRARSPWRLLWLGLFLCGSRTFLSYATAGLENPLLHLLLSGFLVVYLREGRLLPLALFAGLALITRLDSALLFGPPLLHAAFRAWQADRRRALRDLLLGLAPLLLWELFALFYYGMAVPNTAYAKLNTGIPAGALLRQGLRYLHNLARWDPPSAVAIVCGLLVAARGPDARPRLCAAGLLLHLLYVIRIGGDFMSGRFLAAPLVCALGLLLRAPLPQGRGRLAWLGLAPLPLLCLASRAPGSYPEWLAGRRPPLYAHGIADERVHYYPTTGLLARRPEPRKSYLPHFGIRLREQGRRVVVENCIGQVGYHAGPTVHILDNYALADPLLARLPVPGGRILRIGHFRRDVPAGYEETLLSGRNQIRDRRLAAFYDELCLLTRAPLLASGRLRAILRLNLYRGLP
jgi:arabinofuranosyltransferase